MHWSESQNLTKKVKWQLNTTWKIRPPYLVRYWGTHPTNTGQIRVCLLIPSLAFSLSELFDLMPHFLRVWGEGRLHGSDWTLSSDTFDSLSTKRNFRYGTQPINRSQFNVCNLPFFLGYVPFLELYTFGAELEGQTSDLFFLWNREVTSIQGSVTSGASTLVGINCGLTKSPQIESIWIYIKPMFEFLSEFPISTTQRPQSILLSDFETTGCGGLECPSQVSHLILIQMSRILIWILRTCNCFCRSKSKSNTNQTCFLWEKLKHFWPRSWLQHGGNFGPITVSSQWQVPRTTGGSNDFPAQFKTMVAFLKCVLFFAM